MRDHHAILPTTKRPGELPPAQRMVHDAVVTRLIAAFYPACVKEVTTVLGESNGVPFRARGVRVVEPGWTVLYPRKDDEKKPDEQELPEFRPGESGPHEPFVKKGETTPPKPYTESGLLGAMETAGRLVDDEALREALKEKGLGTPATRASIIETLLTRGYVVREKKAILATDAGRYLIALVRDRGLKSPELTGEWEAQAPRDRARPPGPGAVHGGDRPVRRRDHPRGGGGDDRRGAAGRLPALRPAGDRGEARVRLLRLEGGLPVRAVEGVPGATRWTSPTSANSCSGG